MISVTINAGQTRTQELEYITGLTVDDVIEQVDLDSVANAHGVEVSDFTLTVNGEEWDIREDRQRLRDRDTVRFTLTTQVTAPTGEALLDNRAVLVRVVPGAEYTVYVPANATVAVALAAANLEVTDQTVVRVNAVSATSATVIPPAVGGVLPLVLVTNAPKGN